MSVVYKSVTSDVMTMQFEWAHMYVLLLLIILCF